jgi:hypothetical protein
MVWAGWGPCHVLLSFFPIPVLPPLDYFGFISFLCSPIWYTHEGSPGQATQSEDSWCPMFSSTGLQAF